MEYLEIKEGLSIRVCEIEAVEVGVGNTSIIHTHHKSYDSTFPYEVILQLLEIREEKPQEEKQGMNILKEIGVFAG